MSHCTVWRLVSSLREFTIEKDKSFWCCCSFILKKRKKSQWEACCLWQPDVFRLPQAASRFSTDCCNKMKVLRCNRNKMWSAVACLSVNLVACGEIFLHCWGLSHRQMSQWYHGWDDRHNAVVSFRRHCGFNANLIFSPSSNKQSTCLYIY